MKDVREVAATEWDADDIKALVEHCADFVSVMRSDAGIPDGEGTLGRSYFDLYVGSAVAELVRLSSAYMSNHQWDYEDARHELRAPVS